MVSQAFILLLAGSDVLSKMVMVDSPSKMPKETMSKQLTNEIGDGDVVRTNRDTSQHLDSNFRPIRPRFGKQALPDGIRPPTDVPDGFDLSTVEPQENGQFCVFKTLPIESIEKTAVQQCVHRVDKQCYFSYTTSYTPTTEDVCSENYKKKCFIEYTQTSVEETIEKCYHPMERLCAPPAYGEEPAEVCQTQYETSCVTKYKDTPVVENVEECNKVYKKSCEYVKSGYGTEKVCSNKPVKECATVPKTVFKKLPDTTCERIPFEACAPDNCKFVPGEAVCHNKTIDIAIDSPEEVCDLQPQKMCKQIYRLVPKLEPQEICEDVPREVCFTTLQNPQPTTTPLLTKWCFTPEPEENEVSQGYGAPPPSSYAPSAPVFPPPPPPQQSYAAALPPPVQVVDSYPAPPPPPPTENEVPAYPPPPTNYGAIQALAPPKTYGFKLVEPSAPPPQEYGTAPATEYSQQPASDGYGGPPSSQPDYVDYDYPEYPQNAQFSAVV